MLRNAPVPLLVLFLFTAVVAADGEKKNDPSEKRAKKAEIVIRSPQRGSTPITFLVKNGARVKRGEILVKFATKGADEKLDNARVAVNQARAQVEAAKVAYQSVDTGDMKLAEVRLKVAELQRAAVDSEMRLEIETAEHEAELANKTVALLEQRFQQVKVLVEAGKSDAKNLHELELALLKGKAQMRLARAKHDHLLKRERPLRLARADAAVLEAHIEVDRAKRSALSQRTTSRAKLAAMETQYNHLRAQLARREQEIRASVIYAPAAGVVRWAIPVLREGAIVRQNQPLLILKP